MTVLGLKVLSRRFSDQMQNFLLCKKFWSDSRAKKVLRSSKVEELKCKIALSNTFYSPTGHFFAVYLSAHGVCWRNAWRAKITGLRVSFCKYFAIKTKVEILFDYFF